MDEDISVVSNTTEEPATEAAQAEPVATPAQEEPEAKPSDDEVSVVSDDTKSESKSESKSDAKTEEPKPADEKKPAETPVPENYNDLSFPEGIKLDEDAMKEITPVLQALKCDKATAQKLADFHFKQMTALIAAQNKEFETAKTTWVKELREDPEIGGHDLKVNLSYGARLLNKYGSKELSDLLVSTGLDRNPAMVRFLVKLGKEHSEDSWADSGRHGTAPKNADDVARMLFNKTL